MKLTVVNGRFSVSAQGLLLRGILLDSLWTLHFVLYPGVNLSVEAVVLDLVKQPVPKGQLTPSTS